MFGIGPPEFVVIFLFLCPVFAVFVFISKAEKRMEKDRGAVIQQIDDIVQQLREKKINVFTSDYRAEKQILSGNYLSKHWRGELSLVISYWINFVLVGIAFKFAGKIIEESNIYQSNLLLGIQFAALLLLVSLPVTIWQIRGCWQSANRHVDNTGKVFWARFAQVIIVLGGIQVGVAMFNNAPTFVEMIKIASRTEEYKDYTVTVLGDGKEIEIKGHMGFGIDKELEKALEKAPKAWLIHLNSPGGRLGPARKVRDLIDQRGLKTYTSTECSSACLIPFMAGRYRILNSNAKLGFHSYHFPGISPSQMVSEMVKDKRYYVSVGVGAEFLDKAFSIDSKELWYPEIDELIQNKVITHTFDGKKSVSYINK